MFNKKYLFQYIIRTLSIIIFFITGYYFKNQINDFIYKYLTVNSDWSNKYVDSFILITIGMIFSYLVFSLFKRKYLYSQTQYFILLTIISSIILLLIIQENWYFTSVFSCEGRDTFKHIYLILFPILILTYLGFIIWLIKPEKPKNQIIFKEDNALDYSQIEKGGDLLNYLHIAEKLKKKILPQNFECSFTIGIIGPWGNGKSSFINLLRHQFKNEDIIPVHFHPYLNHTESEISSEFFHAFQSALSPYSGKLSNLILEYSNKLLNLYNDKNLKSFYNRELIGTKSSAHDTLLIINEALIEINKKIIVFVDDLDRLNQDEILQVLKLIRNTANFSNTVFIVAMDKGYVLNRLNTDSSISNNKFIDKFFQLEIYLPEINKSILRNIFIETINKSISIDQQIKIELKELVASRKILFDDHIRNLRDVKRVSNQIIFEFDLINEEINLADFINFILLKLAFPRFIDLLKRNPTNYLNKSGSYYFLIPVKEENTTDFFYKFRIK